MSVPVAQAISSLLELIVEVEAAIKVAAAATSAVEKVKPFLPIAEKIAALIDSFKA